MLLRGLLPLPPLKGEGWGGVSTTSVSREDPHPIAFAIDLPRTGGGNDQRDPEMTSGKPTPDLTAALAADKAAALRLTPVSRETTAEALDDVSIRHAFAVSRETNRLTHDYMGTTLWRPQWNIRLDIHK